MKVFMAKNKEEREARRNAFQKKQDALFNMNNSLSGTS